MRSCARPMERIGRSITGSGKLFHRQRDPAREAQRRDAQNDLDALTRSLRRSVMNAVEYFVSIRHMAGAYVPASDTTSKKCDVNEESDRLRMSATRAC